MRNRFSKLTIIFCLFVVCNVGVTFATQDADGTYDQKILGFNLSNFGKDNQKTWDLEGDTLVVNGDVLHLTKVKAKMYNKQDNMLLTADTGTYNKQDSTVHLQDNVVITTDTGAKVTTDSLDWAQKEQTVTTNDKINISKGNVAAEGMGALGKTDMQQFSLNKDVKVDVNKNDADTNKKANSMPVTITCDGPLDIDYQKGTAIFNNNVQATDEQSQLFADKMTGYFNSEKKEMDKIICEGNVKIVRGKDIAYAEKAIYNAKDRTISLIGRPKLVIYSQQLQNKEEDKVEIKTSTQEEEKK